MAVRLSIKREGSLLSVIRDQELTDTQLMAIEIVLDNERMAYNVVEDDRITKLIAEQYGPDILGLVQSETDKTRLFGIEQYQAESR